MRIKTMKLAEAYSFDVEKLNNGFTKSFKNDPNAVIFDLKCNMNEHISYYYGIVDVVEKEVRWSKYEFGTKNYEKFIESIESGLLIPCSLTGLKLVGS